MTGENVRLEATSGAFLGAMAVEGVVYDIESTSGARIETSGLCTSAKVEVTTGASSGGTLTLLAISGGDFRLAASSGGQAEIEGSANEFDAAVSSGGRIRADRLAARDGRLDASSGGQLEANVTTRLRANASSGGHIEVLGSPAERNVNSSSGGRVAFRT